MPRVNTEASVAAVAAPRRATRATTKDTNVVIAFLQKYRVGPRKARGVRGEGEREGLR